MINENSHYSDVKMSTMASHDCLLNLLLKRRSKDIKAPRHWPLWGLPVNSPHKCPVTRKCFHLITSSWVGELAKCSEASPDTTEDIISSWKRYPSKTYIAFRGPLIDILYPCLSNYAHGFIWDVIIHPRHNLNGVFTKPSMKLVHRRVIISHYFTLM